jgi:hypothetical protein
MRISRRPFGLLAAGLFLAGTVATHALGCPFCSAPSQTLAEQVAQADAVCLVQYVKGEAAKDQDPGTSTYEVVQAVKSPKDSVKKGDHVNLARFRPGKPGDLFLVMGTRAGKDNAIEWGSPTEITEPAFAYVAQAPAPEVATTKRLKYFVRFMEFPDPLVANDAFGEFANAPYKDIATVASTLPREKIRGWLTRPETPQTRLGLYGMLLGLCGNDSDAKLLAEKIAPNSDEFRIGLDGMISGYLLLTGNPGLDKIDDWKFKIHEGKKAAFSETYAAMMGLRFMWQYSGGKISNERLQQSMRILLDQPELADLVIADLARWKDWSVQERLMSLYGKGDYNIPSIKRSIIRYMLASTEKGNGAAGAPAPATTGASGATASGAQSSGGADSGNVASDSNLDAASRGKKYLEELRKKDPRTVREAERFFFPK